MNAENRNTATNSRNCLLAGILRGQKKRNFLLFVFTVVFFSSAGAKQKKIIQVDLAGDKTQKITKNPGTYNIEFLNIIPDKKYSVEIGAVMVHEMTLLDAGGAATHSVPEQGCAFDLFFEEPKVREAVAKTKEAVEAAATAADKAAENAKAAEEKVREAVAEDKEEAKASAKKATQAAEKAADKAENQANCLKKLKRRTRFKSDRFTLPEESSITVTVKREASDSIAEEEWAITITSGVGGKWQTTFGWMFTANRDEDYFTEPADENGKFRIVRQKRSPNSLTSLPSVFWHWLPAGQAHKKLQHGPTAGVGISIGEDASRPAVFAGYTLRYQQNIGIVSGVGVYSRHVLNGRYGEGAVVASDLDSSQLTENANHFMFFAGVTFRVNFAKLFGQGNDVPSGE